MILQALDALLSSLVRLSKPVLYLIIGLVGMKHESCLIFYIKI